MYTNESLYLKCIIVYLFKFYSIKSSQICFVNKGGFVFVCLGLFNFVLNFWSLPFFFFQFFCKLWAINGSSILFSQLWAIWGFFFLNVKFGVLRFDLVNMPSFQFFLKKLSFQLFSSHFGGLHFIFSKGGWGL
jgi:hypothetical protein